MLQYKAKTKYSNPDIYPDEVLIGKATGRDSEAENELFKRFYSVICAASRNFYLPSGDLNDLEQEAAIGFAKAIKSYDLGKDVPFKNFAALCIRRQLVTALQTAKRQKHQVLTEAVYLDTPLGTGTGHVPEDNDRAISEAIFYSLDETKRSSCEAIYIENEEVRAVAKAIKAGMTDIELIVCDGLLRGKSYQQMADETGRSYKSIDNTIQRIRKKVRQIMIDVKEGKYDIRESF